MRYKIEKLNLQKIIRWFMIVSVCTLTLYIFMVNMISLNNTSSEPIGVYLKYPFKSPNVGDYVTFKIKDKYIKYLQSLNADEKLNKNFIKNISAKEGDHVVIQGENVMINGNLVAKRFDLKDFDEVIVDKVLEKGEYISISKNPYSFDSRYIGIIKEDEINGVYKYIHLFETQDMKKFNTKIFGEKY